MEALCELGRAGNLEKFLQVSPEKVKVKIFFSGRLSDWKRSLVAQTRPSSLQTTEEVNKNVRQELISGNVFSSFFPHALSPTSTNASVMALITSRTARYFVQTLETATADCTQQLLSTRCDFILKCIENQAVLIKVSITNHSEIHKD